MSKIHWLHLSDMHLNKRDVDTRRMRNNLLGYINQLDVQIDYIFLTGDLRYAPAGKFAPDTVEYIEKLLHATNLKTDRLFIIPGNHDIERDAMGRAETVSESIKDYSPKDGTLPSDKMAAIHSGHSEFRDLIHEIYHDRPDLVARHDDNEKPHFVVETDDFNIICIDTALTYTKQRNNNLIVGTEYIMDLFEGLNQKKPSIILTHYSSDFLERSEQIQIVQLMKDFNVQLWLAGHEHTSLMRKQWDYFYEFQSGNLMRENDEYTKSTFMIGTYDSLSYGGIVEVYEWDSDNGWFKMQNVAPDKSDHYSYRLQDAKTMISHIASVSQQEGLPNPIDITSAETNDNLHLNVFGGSIFNASDVHQTLCKVSSGYLYTDINIAPTVKVDIREYDLYGVKYYEIQNEGFQFTFSEIQSVGNISFGYDLSIYSNVSDRLYWFNIISEILNASTLIIKFDVSDYKSLWLSVPDAGSDFERIREETALWKETMERIAKIENYYGVKFYLPEKADPDVYVTINILSDSIDGLPVHRLPVVNMKTRGFFNHFTLENEVWYGDGTDLMSLTLFGYTFKPIEEYILPGEFYWNRKEHGWESDKKNGGVSVRVEFVVDNDITKKLIDVVPISELKDSVNSDDIPVIRGEKADFLSDYMSIIYKVQEIHRQYQMYQKAIDEWILYDLNEEHHLVKKYSGAVIDKVTVNKITKSVLQEGVKLVTKADDIIQMSVLQNESEFLNNRIGDNLGFQFMMVISAYERMGHWAVSVEDGESFYNLTEMCAVLRTVSGNDEGSTELLEDLNLLKDEMEAQGINVLHIDHYNIMRNFIYVVADIYMTFFDEIQMKLEDIVTEIQLFLEENPEFIVQKGKFKGWVFYQTDSNYEYVDTFDPSGNIMTDFYVFQNEAVRNRERTLEGLKNPEELTFCRNRPLSAHCTDF